jgi:hypothetical protein
MRNPWELTPKQYYRERIKQMAKESGLTEKEVREIYPYEVIEHEYYLEFEKWVHSRVRIPNKVLDRLTDRARYRAMHDYPDLYRDYMPPEIRKMNREAPRIFNRVANGGSLNR